MTRLDRAFEKHIMDHRIFINSRVKPVNMAEIIGKMVSLTPESEELGLTQEKFDRFEDCSAKATSDPTMMSTVLPIISGYANVTTNAITVNGLLLDKLEALTDGSLVKAVSSCCDGLLSMELDPQIRKDLGPHIMPSSKTIGPCLPNFVVEGKVDNWLLAKRQGCYCGTLAARGVHQLRSYVDPDTTLDNKAYVIVATYPKEGTLKLFTIHPTRYKDDEISYLMTPVDTYNMNINLESFQKGVRALRNARD